MILLFVSRSLLFPQVDCPDHVQLRLVTLNRTIGSICTQSRLDSKLSSQSRVFRAIRVVSRSCHYLYQ